MTEEKFTEIVHKQKAISYIVSGIVSLINLLIMFQTIAALWGIRISITAPQITRAYLLQYEYYIRILVTIELFVLFMDSLIFRYYKRKYGTEPPREYGIAISLFVIGVNVLAYYVYQIWSFLYFAILGTFSLTYYLLMVNPYLESVRKSKYISQKG
jgi:hypothetical protein